MVLALNLLLLVSAVHAAPQGDRLATYASFFKSRQVTKADLQRRASSRLTARQSTISPGFCTIASDCTKTTPTAATATCNEGLCAYTCPGTSTLNADKTACECPAPQIFNAASTACVACATAANCPAAPENGYSVCLATGACGFVCNGGYKKDGSSCISTLTAFQDCPYIDGFYLAHDFRTASKQCAYTKNGDATKLIQYCQYYLNTGKLIGQPTGGANQPKLVCPDQVAESQPGQGSACYLGCPTPPEKYELYSSGTNIYRNVQDTNSYRQLSCQYRGYDDPIRCGNLGQPACKSPPQSCYYDIVTGKNEYSQGKLCPANSIATDRCISTFPVKVSFNPEYSGTDTRY